MDIQTIFYLLASIFMFLGIVFFIGLIALLWRLEKTAHDFKKNTTEKIASITQLVQEKKFIGLISLIGMGIKWVADRKNR